MIINVSCWYNNLMPMIILLLCFDHLLCLALYITQLSQKKYVILPTETKCKTVVTKRPSVLYCFKVLGEQSYFRLFCHNCFFWTKFHKTVHKVRCYLNKKFFFHKCFYWLDQLLFIIWNLLRIRKKNILF